MIILQGTETNIIENNWIRRPLARVHNCPSRFDLLDPNPFSLVRSTTPDQNQSILKNIEMERIEEEYETELVTALPKNVLVTNIHPGTHSPAAYPFPRFGSPANWNISYLLAPH